MNSSIKNFNCMLNLNKFGDNQQYVRGYSDHPAMPSINDLLYASKNEIDSFKSLISILQPNSTLENLMFNDNTVSSFHKKNHYSHFKTHRKGHRKKKRDHHHQAHLNYIIPTNTEDVEQEIAQLEREIEQEINENSAATSNISRENNQYDIQGIFESISRRRTRQEISNLEEEDTDLSGILSSSSNNSSRNSTSHSRNRDRNEVENANIDTDSAYSNSSEDEDESTTQSSNTSIINRRSSVFNRMFELALQFVQNDHSNQNENANDENQNIENENNEEESDRDIFNEDDDNYEDIGAIFDSINDNRDDPSPLHTVHANTAILTAAAQLTPSGETEEIVSSFNELPDSFTDFIDDELGENEINLKEKKKSSKKRSKKIIKSGLPIPGPMTLEEAFDFISFVKKEASNTSNGNNIIDNESHNHNRSKKKVTASKDTGTNLTFC